MHHRVALAAAALAALGTVACSAKQESPANSLASASGTAAGPAPSTPPVVTIHAKDFAFQAPKQIPAGMTTFHVVNDGPGLHHVTIVRLADGKSMSDLSDALKNPGPLPDWATLVGGPNAPDPGHDANATLSMTPGNYALLCFVDVPGGVPHFAKGMAAPLTVVASSTPSAPAPAAGDTLTLDDYSFEIASPITSGTTTFLVRNVAKQPHEVELIKLAPGKTPQDVLAWMQKPNGPPPGNAMGGVAANTSDSPAYFTADITPGDYLLICFLPDAKDGKPHFTHGMMQTIHVT
jgi:uncharacterized cupredoxin-like copper-binding protein